MHFVLRTTALILLAISSAVFAEETVPTNLRIELTGLQSAQGDLYISVWDNKDSWLGKDTVAVQQVVIDEARDGELVFADFQLPPGDYALSVFYDANNNGKLDTNFIGIPKEPVALSNNARARFGPPKYKDAVFSLSTEPLTQRISMEKI